MAAKILPLPNTLLGRVKLLGSRVVYAEVCFCGIFRATNSLHCSSISPQMLSLFYLIFWDFIIPFSDAIYIIHSSLAQPTRSTNMFSNLKASGPQDHQSQNVRLEKGHGSRDESHPRSGVKLERQKHGRRREGACMDVPGS